MGAIYDRITQKQLNLTVPGRLRPIGRKMTHPQYDNTLLWATLAYATTRYC